MQSKFYFLVYCLISLLPLYSFGNKVDTIMVKDLSDEFLIFDPDFKTFVPAKNSDVSSVNIFYDFSPYENYNLVFKAKPGLSLFINHSLVYENISSGEETSMIPVNEILKNHSEKSLLTFYHKKRKVPEEVSLAHISTGIGNADVTYESRFSYTIIDNRLFYLFILVLITFAFIRQRYPKKVNEIVYSNNEENINLYDFFNWPSILFIIFNSMCFTYLIVLFPFYNFLSAESLWNIFFLTTAFFVAFYIKYFLLHIVSSIFDIQGFEKVHFLETIRLSTRFNLLLVPIATIIRFSDILEVTVSYATFIIIVILMLVIVLFKLILLTFRVSGFKNIYLFSYLCIAEVIPLGFALKVTLLS